MVCFPSECQWGDEEKLGQQTEIEALENVVVRSHASPSLLRNQNSVCARTGKAEVRAGQIICLLSTSGSSTLFKMGLTVASKIGRAHV